jgi:hypothetical protein
MADVTRVAFRNGKKRTEPITIVYITGREDPHLEWLMDSLERQTGSQDHIELVVVDAYGRSASAIGYRPIRAVRKLIETMPKPSIWQGPHRITAHDFYANSNARNTGIALCRTGYICFLDDRCRLLPGWFETVQRGARKRSSVLCGTYTKLENDGPFIDHRRDREPDGLRNCSGGWCFGCNIALPLEWALEVNGFEEGCDPVGLEDCMFGLMLANAGYRIDFVVEMCVELDRRGPRHPPNFPRHDKGKEPCKSVAIEERYRSRTRTEFTPNLTKIREQLSRGKGFPLLDPSVDYRDWYDGSAIRNMAMSEEDRNIAEARR